MNEAPAPADKQRAALRRQIDELDAIQDGLEAARRLAAEPYEQAIDRLEGMKEDLLERHDCDIRGKCECCSRVLLFGEQGHAAGGDDCILWCEAHAPTWSEMLAQYKELAAIPDADEDDAREYAEGLAACQGNVDAGEGDTKHVWAL